MEMKNNSLLYGLPMAVKMELDHSMTSHKANRPSFQPNHLIRPTTDYFFKYESTEKKERALREQNFGPIWM